MIFLPTRLWYNKAINTKDGNRMNIDTQINRLIAYIETNLNTPLDSDVLARIVFTSRMQLHRNFYSAVGHTAKSYIAKRRLSAALAHIKASELPLADIAFIAGYSSQQALCRAVKQETGMTPLEYRTSDRYFDFSPYNGTPLYPVSVAEEQIPEMRVLRYYDPCLRGLEDRAVELFSRTMRQYNGRLFGRNGEQRKNRFCYELLAVLCDDDLIWLSHAGFEIGDIQHSSAQMYATVAVVNDEEKIGEAWDYLYKTWLGGSMFEHADAPYFEEYINSRRSAAVKPSKLRLWLPIKKRGGNSEIRLIEKTDLCFLVSSAKGENAERDASRRIINYVSAHHPYSVKMMREFFVKKKCEREYICGVRIGSSTSGSVISDPNVCEYNTAGQSFLVFESSVMGDYDRMAETLLNFAKNSRFDADADSIFAVYDASESYDTPKVRMYCSVKMLQIGNTPAREHGIMDAVQIQEE